MGKKKNKENTATLFNRYLWLVNTISTSGPITLKEIQERWRDSICYNPDEISLPRETFGHHRRAVEKIFGIDILCNSRHEYYIEEFGVGEDREQGVRRWMLNSLSMTRILHETRSIQDRILFERNNPDPQYLLSITEAMSESTVILLNYCRYNREPVEHRVMPFCLKNFRQRWYMVAKTMGDDRIKTFALDERIKGLRKTAEKFVMPADFNAEEHFKNSFGIMVLTDRNPQLIKIRVTPEKAHYLRSLPIHHTQEEEGTDGDKVIFSYYLTPAYDFNMELLRHGRDLEVLQPEELRQEIAAIVGDMLKLYE